MSKRSLDGLNTLQGDKLKIRKTTVRSAATDNRLIYLPDADGTLAMADVVPAGAVDTTTNQVIGGNKTFNGSTLFNGLVTVDNNIQFQDTLLQQSASAPRTIIFPDASGTVALSGGLDSQYVDQSTNESIGGVKTFTNQIVLTRDGQSTASNASLYVNPLSTALSGANNYRWLYLAQPPTTGSTTGYVTLLEIEGNPSGGAVNSAIRINAGNIRLINGRFQSESSGTASTVAFQIGSTSNNGLYSSAANTIDIATNGTLRLSVNTTDVTSTLPLYVPAGSAAAPSLTFTGDTNSGVYSGGADIVNVATSGTERVSVSTTTVTSSLPIVIPLGSEAAPSLRISGDANTGVFSSGADTLNVTTGGTERCRVNNSEIISTVPVVVPVGSAAAPSLTFAGDNDTGVFRVGGGDVVGVTAGGTQRFSVSTTSVTSLLPVNVPAGSIAAASLYLNGDVDTGFYQPNLNEIGITCGGTESAQFTSTQAIVNNLLADSVRVNSGSTLNKIQCGTATNSGVSAGYTITFPTAFSAVPIVTVTCYKAEVDFGYWIQVLDVTTTDFEYTLWAASLGGTSVFQASASHTIHWVAIQHS